MAIFCIGRTQWWQHPGKSIPYESYSLLQPHSVKATLLQPYSVTAILCYSYTLWQSHPMAATLCVKLYHVTVTHCDSHTLWWPDPVVAATTCNDHTYVTATSFASQILLWPHHVKPTPCDGHTVRTKPCDGHTNGKTFWWPHHVKAIPCDDHTTPCDSYTLHSIHHGPENWTMVCLQTFRPIWSWYGLLFLKMVQSFIVQHCLSAALYY